MHYALLINKCTRYDTTPIILLKLNPQIRLVDYNYFISYCNILYYYHILQVNCYNCI